MNGVLDKRLSAELENLKEQDSFRILRNDSHKGKYSVSGGMRMLNLSSNDYLGLSCDVDLQSDFLNSIHDCDFVMSSCSSRLLTGNFGAYAKLENLLCEMYGREAAVVFSSGYHANSGILPAVADGKCLILADKLVHASIIEGLRLSSATVLRYRHNDYGQLERLIAERAGNFDCVIVVTESVFSMDGDIADLRLLADLKKKYPNVCLYVDEAHAVGVRGERGLGLAEEFGVIDEIDFLVGTFGKAIASFGAFVLCSQVAREYLINKARTLIYTTALPPVVVEWTYYVLSRLQSPYFSEKRLRLSKMAGLLRNAVIEKGYGCASASHIVPVVAGENDAAVQLASDMRNAGFYVLPLRPPTVPQGSARLRLSLTAALDEKEIQSLIAALPVKSSKA